MRSGLARLGCATQIAVVLTALGATQPQAREAITVFAAASLKNALDDVISGWTREGGDPIRLVLASSSALARQIDRGAPADLFISAHRKWIDWLEKRGKLTPGLRVPVLGNRLVMIAPRAQARPLDISLKPILARLGDRRLATGDPQHVPAGLYAKAALTSLGLWAPLKKRLAPTANVRAALALVARREVPLGIVYRSDAAAEPRVSTVATFPSDSYPAIEYQAVIPKGRSAPRVMRFLVFSKGSAATAAFRRQGFCAPPPCSD